MTAPREKPRIVFDDVTILPSQLIPAPPETPERKLMSAILAEVFNTLEKYRGTESRRAIRLVKEACDWLTWEDDSWLYSLGSICDHLGLDRDSIREEMLAIAKQNKKSPKEPVHRYNSRSSNRRVTL